jgi:hypothetical protein
MPQPTKPPRWPASPNSRRPQTAARKARRWTAASCRNGSSRSKRKADSLKAWRASQAPLLGHSLATGRNQPHEPSNRNTQRHAPGSPPRPDCERGGSRQPAAVRTRHRPNANGLLPLPLVRIRARSLPRAWIRDDRNQHLPGVAPGRRVMRRAQPASEHRATLNR